MHERMITITAATAKRCTTTPWFMVFWIASSKAMTAVNATAPWALDCHATLAMTGLKQQWQQQTLKPSLKQRRMLSQTYYQRNSLKTNNTDLSKTNQQRLNIPLSYRVTRDSARRIICNVMRHRMAPHNKDLTFDNSPSKK
jgi:hypothetical protein